MCNEKILEDPLKTSEKTFQKMEDGVFNSFLKWSATFLVILFSYLTVTERMPYNYYVQIASSILWIWWSIRISEKSLIVTNSVILIMFLYGAMK
jgi:hypothetical protein